MSKSERTRGALHREVVDRLREMIVSGELPAGSKIREVELCDLLGVSRTPLREALKTLAGERLLQLRANRSAVVTQLNITEVEQLFQVIGRLESLAGELACERATDEELGELVALQATMKNALLQKDLATHVETNEKIHALIVQASRNEVLISTWRALSPLVRRARRFNLLYANRWASAVREHDYMLAALLTRDGKTLGGLMVPHYESGLAAIREGLERMRSDAENALCNTSAEAARFEAVAS